VDVDVVLVVVDVVVVTQAPPDVQPSPTFVGSVSGHIMSVLPFLLWHLDAFTTLLMSLPFLFVPQQTTKPGRPQVEFARKRFTNCFLQAPVSIRPSAFLACLTYFPCLVALAHGTVPSTWDITISKFEVSVHVLAACAVGAARRSTSSATTLRSANPILMLLLSCSESVLGF